MRAQLLPRHRIETQNQAGSNASQEEVEIKEMSNAKQAEKIQQAVQKSSSLSSNVLSVHRIIF